MITQGLQTTMLKFIFCLFLSLVSQASLAISAPPPADAVFKLSVNASDPNTMTLHWLIKPGFFLYKTQIKITTQDQNVLELLPPALPKAQKKIDNQGKTLLIYRHKLRVPLSILGKNPGEIVLDVHYQGCSDDGFCYPPQTSPIKLTIDAQLALVNATLETTPLSEPSAQAPLASGTDPFAHHHWSITLLIFLGLGLLLSFTPCVLPMIPVLSGIIVGHGKPMSTRHAFLISLSYVLSMSLTYAFVGAVVAQLGQNLQVIMQTPWVTVLFSLLFVALALAMFNVYELRLPVKWQAALARRSYHQAHGSYLGAAIMGVLSTLILSPCVTAPLIGALSYIARTGNVLLGISALFALGFGMGIPLLLIGTSLGKWLPHAGRWMNIIKILFGVLLLAMAGDLISRVLPSLSSNQSTAVVVTTQEQVRAALNDARLQGKPVVLDFYADWCRSCKIMEKKLHQDAEVQNALKSLVILKVDITANDAQSKALLNQYGVIAPPTFLFLNTKGQELVNLRVIGELSPHTFLTILQAINATPVASPPTH
jgi:thiol:disulfide interchange protein DsbD